MSERPSYFSILTADIRYDPQLRKKPELQVMFSEITALSNKWGYCTATNTYFANLYDLTTVAISNRITKLVDLGFLKRELIKDGNQIKERRLYPIINRGIKADFNRGNKVNFKRGIKADFKENITSINKEEEINKKENLKSNLLQELKRFAKCEPNENEWQIVSTLSIRLTYDSLRRVTLNFMGAMHDSEIQKPYAYLIKMMRDELENQKLR